MTGVYDADAETLHVYLNGQLDDGFLLGRVGASQQASNVPVCVGRRGDARGYEFAGLIDEVRIDSRALCQAEIEQSMRGVEIASGSPNKSADALSSSIRAKRRPRGANFCHQPTSPQDAIVPAFMVAVGVLSALACACLWPGYRLRILGVSLAVGLLLSCVAIVLLPSHVTLMLPLLSLTGSASVAFSVMHPRQST